MTYQLGVDLGTTYTAAAIARDGDIGIVHLGTRSAAIPSIVFLKEDETILVGEAAQRRGITEGHRVAREFKRRIGDTTPIILGSTPYSAEALMARLLGWVVDEVAKREGGAPQSVTVTHPANWGNYKKDLLQQAIRLADISSATLITEPEAAVLHYASQARVDTGRVIAVYDLGGGTFDAAILRKTADGFEPLGTPEGIERLGGIDFDEAVFRHVQRALESAGITVDATDPQTVSALWRLRDECVEAKEALSSDSDVAIPVLLPNVSTEIRLTRNEFEAMIRPSLADTLGAMKRAVRGAALEMDQVDAVLLVGGSSRVPVVGELVAGELGRPVVVDAHPKHAIALGAALYGANHAQASTGSAGPEASAAGAAAVAAAAATQATPPPAPVAPTPPPPVAPEPAATAAPVTPGEVPPTEPTPAVATSAPPIAAAPAATPPHTPSPLEPPASSSGGTGPNKGILIGAAVAVVAVIAAIAVFALGGGGDDDTTAVAATDDGAATDVDEAGDDGAEPDTADDAAAEVDPTPEPTVAEEPTVEPTPEPTEEPTAIPTPTPLPFPPDARRVELTDIQVNGSFFEIFYDTFNYEPSFAAGEFHIHFFWDTYPPASVGSASSPQNPWTIWALDGNGDKRFDDPEGRLASQRPADATGICAVVANSDHEVDAPEIVDATVSCIDLPGGNEGVSLQRTDEPYISPSGSLISSILSPSGPARYSDEPDTWLYSTLAASRRSLISSQAGSGTDMAQWCNPPSTSL